MRRGLFRERSTPPAFPTTTLRTGRARLIEKTGVFTGAYALHPVTGDRVPIWIADYVLIGYGTGAIMAVPGHDQRDWEFARQFDLSIVEVVSGGDVTQGLYGTVAYLGSAALIFGARPPRLPKRALDKASAAED